MIVDKNYCMSSFLTFRCIDDENKAFVENLKPNRFYPDKKRYSIRNSDDIDNAIKEVLQEKLDECTGIMLSGGIDSAILASYMPSGTKAYTLKCIAEGAADETERARAVADKCNLDHRIVEIYWEDYLNFVPQLMKHKGAPIHSIEPQIYKAALQAKNDGVNSLIFGEAADAIFGGLDGLLSKDWLFDEFIERYTYVKPEEVLKESVKVLEPFERYRIGNKIDFYKFISEFFYAESVESYTNALELAGIEFIAPYAQMYLEVPLNIKRIRSGDSKYLIKELFVKLFPDFNVIPKLPMPRAVKQWLKDWKGPKREEFLPDSIEGFSGDQKWLVYCLEWFLDLLDEWSR